MDYIAIIAPDRRLVRFIIGWILPGARYILISRHPSDFHLTLIPVIHSYTLQRFINYAAV